MLESLIDAMKEFHFAKSRKSSIGRAEILRLLNSPRLSSETVKATVIHKAFMVCMKFFDFVIEPQLFEMEIDFYSAGLHIRVTNSFHGLCKSKCPRQYSDFLKTFVGAMRERTGESIEHFYRSMDLLETSLEGTFHVFFHLARQGRSDLELWAYRDRMQEEPNELDPAAPALNALVREWSHIAGDVEIYHDESKEIKRTLPILRNLWTSQQSSVSPKNWDGTDVRYPSSITSIKLVNSELYPLVQIADVVAGAINTIWTSQIKQVNDQKFLGSLKASRCHEFLSESLIWPTKEFFHPSGNSIDGFTSWHPESFL